MKIENTPPYAIYYRFIVYRMVDDVAWFWGAWNDAGEAAKAAQEIGGFVYDKEGKET